MVLERFGLAVTIMSGSKGAKRISVFDRLGPGNDEVRGGVNCLQCHDYHSL